MQEGRRETPTPCYYVLQPHRLSIPSLTGTLFPTTMLGIPMIHNFLIEMVSRSEWKLGTLSFTAINQDQIKLGHTQE